MNTEQTTQIQSIVNSLVPDLLPEVKRIEQKPATTQNHYGDYMNLLSVLGKNNKGMTNIIALALIAAGANAQGVRSAVSVLF